MPTLAVKPWNPQTSNADIIAAIRHEASSEYQRRIPDEIKADVQKTMQQLNNYTPAWNEFVAAIVNKIGLTIARNNSWTNPLARYKKGLLDAGDTVEEIQTGLIQGYVFDPRREYGERALFGKHLPEVQTSYHTVNRESIYPLTVQRSTLQRAFLTDDGLAQFITQLMEAASTSDNWDEYLLTVNLFREYEKNGGFFKVHVADIANPDSTEADSRSGLRTLREYAETLPFLSRQYNAARMPVHANPDDMILITTPQFKSGLDVNALAAMFNVSYAEVPFKTHVIPQHDIGIPGVQSILTTVDFFQIYDTYFNTDSQPNPAGRYENFFLHHDQIVSASRFVPAIAFTTGEGDVIEIVDTPVTGMSAIKVYDNTGAEVSTVKRGQSYTVEASALTIGDNSSAVLTLSGKESNFTYLAQSGTFHVSIDEKSTSLKIDAVAEDDAAQTATKTVAVYGELVEFWPEPSVNPDADSDGIPEVTPDDPAFVDNVITIPNVKGVQYKNGTENVTNGSTITVEVGTPVTITAEARSGYELAAGATASWTFTAA